jgi:prevent-host-death family protein
VTTILQKGIYIIMTVGIKELKTKLSSYIDRVGRGERIIITEHGKGVAVIVPISSEQKAIHALIESGKADWSGGKPHGIKGIRIEGKALSETILEERI